MALSAHAELDLLPPAAAAPARGAGACPFDAGVGRGQTAREEQLNALSHGLGFVGTAAAWPMLSDLAAQQRGPLAMLGVAVFCLSAMLVYAASMAYHALPPGRAKQWARRGDHAAIFVFIAGSYTPFALGPLFDTVGPQVLAGAWSLAVVGAGCKILGRLRHRVGSTLLYGAMGWVAVVLLDPLSSRLGPDAVALLLAGGAAYTVGVLFFLFDHRLRYGHFVWHLFVLAGSTCHVLAAVSPVA
ncbi:MAG TPA: hemolysin III family protein [Rubrivivax sp.]|nr:hemolysin III family protein [Rubrivivax sp.]